MYSVFLEEDKESNPRVALPSPPVIAMALVFFEV